MSLQGQGKRKAWQWGLGLALCFVLFSIMRLLEGVATRLAISEESQRAEASVVLLESSFRRELEKFRMASVVLARDPDARQALANPSETSAAQLNRKFEALSKDMQAASIYLLDSGGTALASSNWRDSTSFVGKNYSFRAYFREGMAMGSHQQFALGNVSRKPGLYISRRIDFGGGAKGIVVIKVEFDQLEAEWRGYGKPAFVTNPAGIVLVTSKPEWRFKSIGHLSVESRRNAAFSRDFGDSDMSQIPIYADRQVARINAHSGAVPKVIEAIKKPSPNWTVHVLADTSDVVAAAVERTRIFVLGSVLLLGSLFVMDLYRRRAIVARAELAAAEQIRDLNDRLAHSHKLSTLGQIAAGVGHEINQPLAAIGTYAASGLMLIDRGSPNSVRDSLVRIGKLSAQIGDITSELRTFARKSPRRMEAINLRVAVDAALLLLRERATSLNAQIIVHGDKGDQTVLAYQGAIEQVIVNLVQNALDACGQNAQIELTISSSHSGYSISISDNGPGLSAEALAGLFQPFTTSKANGLGLGLVISRDLVSEFGGTLTGRNGATGCVFTISLPASTEGLVI